MSLVYIFLGWSIICLIVIMAAMGRSSQMAQAEESW